MLGTSRSGMSACRKARRPLLSSCAIAGALAVTGQAGPASAQSYLGTVSSATNASVDQSVANTTTVTVTAPSAVINWTPSASPNADGVIPFQAAGTQTNFQSSGGDYTVLNRILPGGPGGSTTNPVEFNGLTTSYIGPAGPSSTVGGHIWFYSPGGIMVGASGQFDVGGLGLTTLDITDADFLSGTSSGNYKFQPALNELAKISIAAGGSLTATGADSYIALVAPRIGMDGQVRSGNSIAYVAGTAGDITIHNGLFDINVTQGTSGAPGDSTALSHTGSSTAGSATSGADQRAIYMVAIPKNNAITMLVGGDLSFQASSAEVVNGSIVLRAGSNVATVDYGFGIYYSTEQAPATGFDTNLELAGANLIGPYGGAHDFAVVDAAAIGSIDAHSTAASDLTVNGDFQLTATRAVTVRSGTGQSVLVAGGLNLSAVANGGNSDSSVQGGTATLRTDGGTIRANSVTVDASAYTSSFSDTGAGTDATGGTASVLVNGGALYADSISVQANGDGGSGNDVGGVGQGGSATVEVNGTGTVVANSLNVFAQGYGGDGDSGGLGQGGLSSVTVGDTGSVTINDGASIAVSGRGGTAYFGQSGEGVGGTVRLDVDDSGIFQVALGSGSLVFDATGIGGYDGGEGFGMVVGGNGTAGTAILHAGGSSVIQAGNTYINAYAEGGDGGDTDDTYDAGAGGAATGGTVTMETAGGDVSLGNLLITTGALGGYGGNAYETYEAGYGTGTSMTGGAGGSAQGGTINFLVSGGSFSAASASLYADALGGVGGSSEFGVAGAGGNATGGGAGDPAGGVHVGLGGGTTALGLFDANANGEAGAAGTGNADAGGVAGADGTGGRIVMNVNADLSADTISLSAVGISSDGFGSDAQSTGGNSQGGTLAFTQQAGTLTTSGLSLDASGTGSDGYAGGGAGNGGSVQATLTGGSLTLSSLSLDASGTGGQGFLAGGAAGGGTASLLINNAAVSSTTPVTIAAGAAGGGSPSGTGGAATGGNAALTVQNGGSLAVAGNLSLRASASGGFGQRGGDAQGGSATAAFDGSSLSVTGALNILADVAGGDGSLSGGEGIGGTASLTFDGGPASSVTGDTFVQADGYGGRTFGSDSAVPGRGPGGLGQGGGASVAVTDTSATFGTLTVSADGTGGQSLDGGQGGDGIGGDASISTAGTGGILASSLLLSANGTAISGEVGYGLTVGGNGGRGMGGIATLDLLGTGTTTIGDSTVAATGQGADGIPDTNLSADAGGGPGDGGDGQGGAIVVTLGGGAGTTLSTLALRANGVGGRGANAEPGQQGGAGADGVGGSVSVTARGAGNVAGLANISMDISGIAGDGGSGNGSGSDTPPPVGGSGGDGGNATGGTLLLAAADGGTLDASALTATLLATAGNGGAAGGGETAGTAGDGGNATGGSVQFATEGAGSVLRSRDSGDAGPNVALNATGGSGGNGADSESGNGSAGGAGGDGTGGKIDVRTAGGTIEFGSTSFTANGTGGSGGAGGTGAVAGATGGGTGGQIAFSIDDDPDSGAAGRFSAGATTLETNGLGDGIGTGGTIRIATTSTATGDAVAFGVAPLGDFSATSQGDGTHIGGGITSSADGGRIAFGRDATFQADGDIGFSAGNGGQVRAAGTLLVQTPGTIEIDTFGPAAGALPTVSAGDLRATAGGDFLASSFATDRDAIVDANAITLDDGQAGGNAALTANTTIDIESLTAGQDITLLAGGAIVVSDNVEAGGTLGATGTSVTLVSQGSLNVSYAEATEGAVSVTATDLTVADAGAVSEITLTASNNLTLGSANVSAEDGVVSLTSGLNGTAVSANGNTTITGIVSGGIVQVDSGGRISVGEAAGIYADDSITLRSGSRIELAAGSVIGAPFDADAGTDVGIDSVGTDLRPFALGPDSPSASVYGIPRQRTRQVEISAGAFPSDGAATLAANGIVDGEQIALNSGAIAVGSAAQLGSGDTDLLVFTNNGGGQTYIGGGGTGASYALSNAALSRTRSNVIRVVAPDYRVDEGAPAAVVQTVDLVGTDGGSNANLVGGAGSFQIESDGDIRVEGAVTLASAGDEDDISLNADGRIDVVTPTGSLGVFNANGGLTGELQFIADTITVGSAQAIADLGTLTTLAQKSARLGTNDGEVNDAGFLQAGGLRFTVRQGLYIQNSGANSSGSTPNPDARRGFTAGSLGVGILTRIIGDGAPVEIAINGRQALADGTFATGEALTPLLQITGYESSDPYPFDQRSTVNGCLIVGMSCQFEERTPIVVPVQDIIRTLITPTGEEKEAGAGGDGWRLDSPVIDLADFQPYEFAPMIDEPVTGAGNDGFWAGDGGASVSQSPAAATPPQENVDEQVTSTRRDEDEQPSGDEPRQ